MSVALATALVAGTLVACDEQKLPEESTTIDPTIEITESETLESETTESEGTELTTETEEFTTETESTEVTTEEESRNMAEATEEDKAYWNDFINQLAQYDSRYADGIGNIMVEHYDFGEEIQTYTIKIGFPNSNIYDNTCANFELYGKEGEDFLRKASQYHDLVNPIFVITTILCKTTEASTQNDIEFLNFLKPYVNDLLEEFIEQ